MRAKNILSILFIAISLNSCSSDEPQWADPEAHEKTEQLPDQGTVLTPKGMSVASQSDDHFLSRLF